MVKSQGVGVSVTAARWAAVTLFVSLLSACTSSSVPLERVVAPLGGDPRRTVEIHGYNHSHWFGSQKVTSSVHVYGGHEQVSDVRLEQVLMIAGWNVEVYWDRSKLRPQLALATVRALEHQMGALDLWQRANFGRTDRPTIKLVLVPPDSSVSLRRTETGASLDGIGMWFVQRTLESDPSEEALTRWAASLGSLIAHEVAHFMAWVIGPYRDDIDDEAAAYLLQVCFELESLGRAGLRLVRVVDSSVSELILAGDAAATAQRAKAAGLHPTLAGVAVAQALLMQITPNVSLSKGDPEAFQLLQLCRKAASDRTSFEQALLRPLP